MYTLIYTECKLFTFVDKLFILSHNKLIHVQTDTSFRIFFTLEKNFATKF